MASYGTSNSQREMLDDNVIEPWVAPPKGEKPKRDVNVNVLEPDDQRCLVIGAAPHFDVKLFVDVHHPGPCENYGAFIEARYVSKRKEQKKTKSLPGLCAVPAHFAVKTGSGFTIQITLEGHEYPVATDGGTVAEKAYDDWDGTLETYFKIAMSLKNSFIEVVSDASLDMNSIIVKQSGSDGRAARRSVPSIDGQAGGGTPAPTPMTRVGAVPGALQPPTQLGSSGDFVVPAPLQLKKAPTTGEAAADQAAMQSAFKKCFPAQLCLPIQIMTVAPQYKHGVFSMRQISEKVVDQYATQLVRNPYTILPVILVAVVARGDNAFPNTEYMMTNWQTHDFIQQCSGANSALQLIILGGNHISQAILKASHALQGSDKTNFLNRVKVTLLLNPTVPEAIAFSLHDNVDREKRVETTQLDLFVVARQTFRGAGMPKKNTAARLALLKEFRQKGLGVTWEDNDWSWKIVFYESTSLDNLLDSFKKSDIDATVLKSKLAELKALKAMKEANAKKAKTDREAESNKAKKTPFATKTEKSGSAKKKPKTEEEAAVEKTIQDVEMQIADLKVAKLIGFSITNLRSIIEAPDPDIRNNIMDLVAQHRLTMADAITQVKDMKLVAKFMALVLRYKMDTCPFEDIKNDPEACYEKLLAVNPVALSKANLTVLNLAASLKGKTATIIKKPLESHDQAVRDLINGLRWEQVDQPAGHVSQFQSFTIASAGSEGHIRIYERAAADSSENYSFPCDMTGVTTLLAIPSEAGAEVSNEILIHVLVQALARVPMSETTANRVIIVERSLADMNDFVARFGIAAAAYEAIGVHQLEPIDSGLIVPKFVMIFANSKKFACDRNSYITVNTGKSFVHQKFTSISFNGGKFGLHELLHLRVPFATGLPIVVALHFLVLYYAIGTVWSLFAGNCSWCVAAAMLHPLVHVLATDNRSVDYMSGITSSIVLYDGDKGARVIRDRHEHGDDAFTPETAKEAFLAQREQVFYVVPKDHRQQLGGNPSPAKKGRKEDNDNSLVMSEESD